MICSIIKRQTLTEMKKTYVMLALSLAVTGTITSCKKKGCTDEFASNYDAKAKKSDDSCIYPEEEDKKVEETQVEINSNITESTTWTKDKIYILKSRIAVTSGATLTIEAGTIVKGDAGTGANATALIIAQGAKIMAEGTASEPIIFTSTADNIESGSIDSPNMDESINGLWGGLIILGNAPISADAATAQIEGIPDSDANGRYGGSASDDNSGVLKYVSVRHGGANIGEGNEINGITLGGVGSGTTIDYVEVVSNQDDGIEWFGGSVNVSNAIVWNAGDDAIDTDQAWSGTLDNFIVINPGDECFELDGGEGSTNALHTLKNGSVKADDADGLADMDYKGGAGNSKVDFNGVYFFNVSSGQDFEVDTAFSVATDVVLTSLEATIESGSSLADFFKEGSDASVTSVSAKANTVGADKSAFASWTFADLKGALADFK